MDEFIEQLWEKYSDDYDIRKTDFKQAIQTACKAQRNACRRMCEHKLKTTHNPILDIILTAEIRKEDYE